MKSNLTTRFKNYYTEKTKIIAVYLFGSQATAKTDRSSDVDVGILLDISDKAAAMEKINQYMVDLSEEGFSVPGSTTEMLYVLEENGYMDSDLTRKMVKAVGFRNLIVNEYARIELERVYEIAQNDITDLNDYLKSITKKLGNRLTLAQKPKIDYLGSIRRRLISCILPTANRYNNH